LIGRLQTRDSEGLILNTRQGPRQVQVETETQVLDAQGNSLPLDTLTPGTLLGVFGHFTDEGRTVVADIILVLPQSP